MSPRLALTIVLYATFLGLWAVASAVARRCTSPTHRVALVVLELAAVVQVALDIAGLAGGHRPASLPVHLGYLVASVAVLPIALSSARPGEDDGAWGAAIAAVGCVAMAVVAVRLRVTWSPRG